MCFAVDFFLHPTPSSFFLSLWWWIESILPNYWLDVVIKSGVCLIVYHPAQDFQAHQNIRIIRTSPSSDHPHHQNITCGKKSANHRQGYEPDGQGGRRRQTQSLHLPARHHLRFDHLSLMCPSLISLSCNFLDSRLDMGVVEQARERRDLEPTGPPDRTYKVPDHSHGKMPIGVYVINQILFKYST